MLRILTLHFLLPALIVPAPGHLGPTQSETVFERLLPSGERVYLEKLTITEFRSRPKGSNPHIPENELFESNEYRFVKYSMFILPAGSASAELVWRKEESFSLEQKKLLGRFVGEVALVDVKLTQVNRVFLLYWHDGGLIVDNLRRGPDGSWTVDSSTGLATTSEGAPVVKAEFLDGTPRIRLRILRRDRKGNDEYNEHLFSLKNDKWKKM